MKVTTDKFMIIDGVRVPVGSELSVDRSYKGSVDMIGKRISADIYDEHFKPKQPVKATKNQKEE